MKSFVRVPRRGIIFMRRLQNKAVKRESNNQHNYDEDTYILAMKRFQKEARGLVPGTPEYTAIRNKIYSELRQQKAMENKQVHTQGSPLSGVMAPEFSSFYALLIVVPESTESYETMHILKYFDFPINVEEDNVVRPLVKREMGFKKDD